MLSIQTSNLFGEIFRRWLSCSCYTWKFRRFSIGFKKLVEANLLSSPVVNPKHCRVSEVILEVRCSLFFDMNSRHFENIAILVTINQINKIK